MLHLVGETIDARRAHYRARAGTLTPLVRGVYVGNDNDIETAILGRAVRIARYLQPGLTCRRQARARAAPSMSRIREAGWTPGSRPRGTPGAAGPRSVAGQCDGRVEIDHRSRRFSSSSAGTLSRLATGAGLGGGPAPASVGGVSTPDRTTSARKASARTGLRLSGSGPSSATTRSRSVTRMVSPEAASRTYSLNRLFSALIPTDLMRPR